MKNKEILKKKCNLFNKITLIIEIFIILIAVGTLIASIIGATQNYLVISTDNYTYEKSMIDTVNASNQPIKAIIQIVTYTISFIIIINIRKILKETIKKESPFTSTNIKYIKKISILILIIAIINLSLFSFVFYISILTIYYMLKYGLDLQIESDETL